MLPMQGTRAPFLAGELKSHEPCRGAKKEKKVKTFKKLKCMETETKNNGYQGLGVGEERYWSNSSEFVDKYKLPAMRWLKFWGHNVQHSDNS